MPNTVPMLGFGPIAGSGSLLTTLPPLSLYIHIPWCVRKCPYCDFNSHEVSGDTPERRYIDALISDLGRFPARLMAIEIAIRTFAHAPRNMDVERERRQGSQERSASDRKSVV